MLSAVQIKNFPILRKVLNPHHALYYWIFVFTLLIRRAINAVTVIDGSWPKLPKIILKVIKSSIGHETYWSNQSITYNNGTMICSNYISISTISFYYINELW